MTKKITIPVEIEVPDDVESVAINSCGEVFGFLTGSNPRPVRYSWAHTIGYYMMLQVLNWKETLTKVGDVNQK